VILKKKTVLFPIVQASDSSDTNSDRCSYALHSECVCQ